MHFSAKFLGKVVQVSTVTVVMTLTGCSSLSSLNPFSKSSSKNTPAVLEEFKTTLAIKPVWTNKIGSADVYAFAPASVANFVYAAAADGTLTKIDAVNGQTLWNVNAGMPLTAGVGASGSAVAVAGKKGALLVFDVSGKLLWKAQASSEILNTPVISKNLVIVRSIDNQIAAFDVNSGERKWTVIRPLPPLTIRNLAGIALTEKNAVLAMPGGKLLSLDLASGAIRWEVTAAEPKGATELERVADVAGTPAIIGQEVCVAAYQGRVSCFDLNTGVSRWTKNLSSEVGVSVDERFVFAADAGAAVLAYARNTGASAWKNEKLSNRRLSAPTSFGRAVAVGDGFGYLHFLSREDGSFIGRVSTDGSQILVQPIVAGSSLIVQTKSGTVVAFATE